MPRLKPSRAFPFLLVSLLLIFSTRASRGFAITGPAWPPMTTVTLQLELGSTNVTLLDGFGTWNNSAADALALWNQYLDFLNLVGIANSTAPKGFADGYNSVFFSSTIFGEGFGKDTLAVTVWQSTNGYPINFIETDVIFNSAQTFNSYRGALLPGKYDFHRVALHEFGHVLGLDHINNYPPGQALMEPAISNLDHLADDDISGAIFLYGYHFTSQLEIVGGAVGDSFFYEITANNNPTRYGAAGLPPGLVFDPLTGIVSGACTQDGTFEIAITAFGPVMDVTGTLTVTFTPASLTLGPPYPNPIEVGTSISFAVTGPNDPTSFTATNLPPGLVIDSTTGIVSGIPTISGSFETSFVANGPTFDAAGTFVLTVDPHYPEAVASGLLQSFMQGMTPDPSRGLLYVLTYFGVEVHDIHSLALLNTANIGFGQDMALSADGSTLWVVAGNGGMAVISGFALPDLTPLAPIPKGPFVADYICAGVNNKLYLVNVDGLFQLDTLTGASSLILPRVNASLAFLMAVSPDHRDLYVGYQERYPGMLAHFDIASTIPVLRDQRAMQGYIGRLGVSADGGRLAYEENELIPTSTLHLRTVLTNDFQGPVMELETPYYQFFAWHWSSYDPLVLFENAPAGLDTVSALTGLPIDRWPAFPDTQFISDDGSGNLLFVSSSLGFNAYSLKASSDPLPSPAPNSLLNVSTRAIVGSEDEQLIGGFIITGEGPKTIAFRAIGPSLPLSDPVADPSLELHDASGAVVTGNDNWNTYRDQMLALDLDPWDEHESAFVASLAPGAYTAVVKNANSLRGVGLVELYDLSADGPAKLANLSTRGKVGLGDDVLIGGFIVGSTVPTRVVLRAIGPSLFDQDISGFLLDPVLELHGGNGELISQNDNWRSTQEADIIASGLGPQDDRESAIVATLLPGAYTAIVSGQGRTTGVALVEIYNLDSTNSTAK